MRVGVDCRELEMSKVTGISRDLTNFLTYTATQRPDCELILYGNQDTFIPESLGQLKRQVVPEVWTPWWDQVSLPLNLRETELDIFLSP